MDPLGPFDYPPAAHASIEPHAVLAEVTCTWGQADDRTTALIVHAAQGMLVLEAADWRDALPPLGTEVRVIGEGRNVTGRMAEHGRAGRFLISIGARPVRRALRLRVSLAGTIRCAALPAPLPVEIVDLTTSGCRVNGLELAIQSQVSLVFTPPGRDDLVTVRATVAHSTEHAAQPWIGLSFRLVALRGGL